MEHDDSGPAHEEIDSDVARVLPTLWEAIWRAPFFNYLIGSSCVMIAVAADAASMEIDLRVKVLLVALALFVLIGKWWIAIAATRVAVRSSVEGWSLTERDGRFLAARDGIDRIDCPMSECTWNDVKDLREAGNPAFPNLGVIVIAPKGHLSAVRWLFEPPFIVCGFTEESREMWRRRLLANGAPQTFSP